MEKSETKNNRRMSTPAIVGLTLCGVLLLMFFSYHGYMAVKGSELKTEIAFADDAAKSLNVEMFVVRDEQIIKSSGGNVVSAVPDGTRVGANDTVAYAFADSNAAGNIIRMGEIEELLDYYNGLMNASTHVVGDTTAYDERIIEDLYSFAAMIASGNFTSLYAQQSEIRDAITSKQTATGVKLELSQTIKELEAEHSSLSAQTASYKEIKSGGTGYYISGTDGYENMLDYTKAEEWTISDVENAMASAPAPINDNDAGRLVHGYYWYLACITETSAINALREGNRYTIAFPDSSVDEIKAQVFVISSDHDSGKSLVVFRCNTMNEELSSLRCESAIIKVQEFDGFRIDNRAIRANENNEKGVYVVSGGYMYFRKVKIIYSTDDYSIVANPYKDKDIVENDYPSQYLHLYDEYIIEGRDLSHGKLIAR